jgi:aminoglycoside phosphotransferase (APT) family kinase protein
MSFNDSAPVREGEQLDLVALDAYLRRTLPGDFDISDASLEVQQFPGGHSNLTYLVRYGSQEFVLRRPPVGPVAPTAHDMPREYNLLAAIHPKFPLAPKPILLCDDLNVLGVPFYLMERRRGLIARSNVPAQIGTDPKLRKQLSEAVVDTLVALHDVEIHSSGIVNFGKPIGFVERQVRGWTNRWQRSKTTELPAMEKVIAWLKDRIPINPDATIVHNDFKLDNLMLDYNAPTRIVAVLDWEMCTVGDPLIDVGLLLCYWTMGGKLAAGNNRSLSAITNGPGWLSREEIVERYQNKTGRNLSGILFYETFARFKVAVVVQQIYFRYVRGQTQDERFRNFDSVVRELAEEALDLVSRVGTAAS